MKHPYISYIWCGTTGHQPQQGRCPKMVTDISNSLYRILWIKKVTIQNFIKIGWKTWKLCQYLLRHGCARDLSDNMKLWNSMRFSSLPTMWSFVHFRVIFFPYVVNLTYTLIIGIKTFILFDVMYHLMLFDTPRTPGGKLILSDNMKFWNSIIIYFKKMKNSQINIFSCSSRWSHVPIIYINIL